MKLLQESSRQKCSKLPLLNFPELPRPYFVSNKRIGKLRHWNYEAVSTLAETAHTNLDE